MTAEEILRQFTHVKRANPTAWTARCPSHEDTSCDSLSLRATTDRMLLHCFAGCAVEPITHAVGLRVADLFFVAPSAPPPLSSQIIAIYDYTTHEGDLLHQVVRFGPKKTFKQRRPDGHGGWTWNMQGVHRVWYRLHELVEAESIWVVEGEKDAEALAALGLTATTTPGGSEAFGQSDYAAQLSRLLVGKREVLALRDNDPAGLGYREAVAAACHAEGLTVKLVDLPGVGPKEDVSDWLAAGHPVEELVQIAATAPTWTPSAVPSRWPVYDAADPWEDVTLPSWILEPVLPERGVMWVAGTAHAGKSLFMQYLCLCLAVGRAQACGHFPVTRRPRIFYVSKEDGRGRFKVRRADILAAWDGARVDPVALRCIFREPINLLDADDIAELVRLCRDDGRTILVLDTWTALTPGSDPDSPKEQAALARIVVDLAERIEGLVIVIDHARKNPPAGVSLADLYGPSQKAQRAEHALVLRKLEGDDHRIEVLIDSKDLDGEVRFFLDRSTAGSGKEKWSYAGTVAKVAEQQRAKGSANREAVCQVLPPAADDSIRMEEILKRLQAAKVELEESTIRRHLRSLVTAGRVHKTGDKATARYWQAQTIGQEPSTRSDDDVC